MRNTMTQKQLHDFSVLNFHKTIADRMLIEFIILLIVDKCDIENTFIKKKSIR